MKSRWNEEEAREMVKTYSVPGASGTQGVPEELALRVYSSRLIGSDPTLVLHGGGNTSVKGSALNDQGESVPVLYVKGSGWDLASIEPAGFPAVRLEPLRELRKVKSMSDEAMVNTLRTNLLDAKAPNPSVEALLHAFLPHRFVDHTHASAILSLVDQPDPEARCREVFGDKLAVLPFVFPGFPLAGIAMQAYERDESVQGIVLINHGLFTFGETARQSYESMIDYVRKAEEALGDMNGAKHGGKQVVVPGFEPVESLREPDAAELAQMAAVLRGTLASADDEAPGGFRRMVLHHRCTPRIRTFVDGRGLADYAQRGVATPDHIIRTKNLPLVLPPLEAGKFEAWAQACGEAVRAYTKAYAHYFQAGVAHLGQEKVMLDPLPRVALVPGAGIFTVGRTEKEAQAAADIYEHTTAIITAAEGYGKYTPLGPLALFGMEYWSLEQAKLAKGGEAPFTGQVVVVTGAASGIGLATARAFLAQGAHVALLDRHAQRLGEVAGDLPPWGVATFPCDVTDAEAVAEVFRKIAMRFGGVDMVVSNAGRVWQGKMAEVSPAELRESFELNFFAHQTVAAEAVRVFQRQGTGGQLLFNASKSAFNPGPALGPYTLPKAAVVALMKQYAVDYGADGVRSNAINADRVPTGLFGDGVLEERAQARGLSVDDYLSGNMLGRMVRPRDVADAFVMLAHSERTTGTVVPVDGGNIAAAPR